MIISVVLIGHKKQRSLLYRSRYCSATDTSLHAKILLYVKTLLLIVIFVSAYLGTVDWITFYSLKIREPRLMQSYHSYTSPENELHLSLGYGAVLGQLWDKPEHAAVGSARRKSGSGCCRGWRGPFCVPAAHVSPCALFLVGRDGWLFLGSAPW